MKKYSNENKMVFFFSPIFSFIFLMIKVSENVSNHLYFTKLNFDFVCYKQISKFLFFNFVFTILYDMT